MTWSKLQHAALAGNLRGRHRGCHAQSLDRASSSGGPPVPVRNL